jgi:hypothetical protein
VKCIFCQYWRRFTWTTVKHTGQWVYQTRGAERQIVKGPKTGNEQPDKEWTQTGVFKP